MLRLAGKDERTLARVRELDDEWRRWDAIRRALHEGTLREFVGSRQAAARGGATASDPEGDAQHYVPMFEHVQAQTLRRFDVRIAELEAELAIAAQRRTLRQELGFTGADDATWVTLHLDLSLGGGAPTWGFVAGDYNNVFFNFRAVKPEGDAPGYYGRILNVISDTRPERHAPSLDLATLSDPTAGASFASGPFVSTGSGAGGQGIYNLALMTGNDGRLREGHPADSLETSSGDACGRRRARRRS